MIRLSIAWRIFRREVLDVCRDWSMLFVVILLPFALAPLTTIALVEIEGQQAAEEAADKDAGGAPSQSSSTTSSYRIALLGPTAGPLEKAIRSRSGFVITSLPAFPSRDSGALHTAYADKPHAPEVIAFQEEIRRRVAAGEIDAVLVAGERKLPEKNLTNISAVLLFDETTPRSRKAGRAAEEAIEKLRPTLRKERLKILGQSEEGLRPLRFTTSQVAPFARQLIYKIAHILPVLLITLLATGCYYSAVNAIPGEKERGTLATVLSAPVRPLELLLGKWLSVTLIGIVSAFATTLSMIVTGMVLIRSLTAEAAKSSPDAATALNFLGGHGFAGLLALWPDIGLLLLCLVMVGMILGALTLVVCLFARGANDATYLLSPFLLVILMVAAAPALPSMKWTISSAVVPLLNQALLIRGIFRQETMGVGLVLLSFVSSAVFSLLVLVFGARVFDSERIRFNESGSLKDVLRHGIGIPGAGISSLVAALLIGGGFYVNLATSSKIQIQILASQFWIVALLLAMLWILKLPWRETLSWRAPRPSVWPAAILLGLTAGAVAVPLFKLFPLPEAWEKAFADPFLKMVAEPGGPLIAFALVALLPAFCEEIAFRGLIQAGFLKRFSPGVAILLTSLCFGLAHLSIYRFLPTMLLGLLLGWVAWRTRSIFPGMLIHALNNALALASMTASPKEATPQILSSAWLAIGGTAIAFALGLYWIYLTTRRNAVSTPAQS